MTEPEIGPPKLLFICTRNYYRSRFAEILFNSLARDAGLDWIAGSRGIATELVANLAPISDDAIEGLEARGLGSARGYRRPEQLQESDRVTMRDRINYCGILLDDNQRKYICRLRFNRSQKYLGLFNAQRNEERVPIDDLNHIYRYAEQLKATVSYYDNPVSPQSPPKEA